MQLKLSTKLIATLPSIKLIILDVDGVLTNGTTSFSEVGEMKNFNIRDGLGIKLAQKYGTKIAIISGRNSIATTLRAKNLAIDFVYQGEQNKAIRYQEIKTNLSITDSEILFIGDDIIDIPIFNRAGIAVCPNDAHPTVYPYVDWITKHNGGNGAVREVCDAIITANGGLKKYLQELNDF